MTDIFVTKIPGGLLAPCDQQSSDYLAKLKLGDVVKVKVTKLNNPAFHRKLMALFTLGFEAWEPGELEYKGEKVAKEFKQFRNDMTILAGFFEMSVNLKNEVRLTAKSIAYDSMDHDEREALYNSLVNVLLQRVLTNYSRDDLDEVIARLMEFTK